MIFNDLFSISKKKVAFCCSIVRDVSSLDNGTKKGRRYYHLSLQYVYLIKYLSFVQLTSDGSPTDDDQQPDERADENEQLWNEIVVKIEIDPDSEQCKNLHIFLEGLLIHKELQDSLFKVFEETTAAMDAILAGVMELIVKKLYNERSEMISDKDIGFVQLMKDNHECRKRFLSSLESKKEHTDFSYDNLVAKTLNLDAPVEPTESFAAGGGDTPETMRDDSINHSAESEFVQTEPDWNEIAQLYEPSVVNIESFIEGRELSHQTEQHFVSEMEDFEAALKDQLESFKSFVTDYYQAYTNDLNEQRDHLRSLFVSNVQSRTEYEALIADQVQQAQSRFANLKSLLLGSFGQRR
jgi:hypothetical protein